MQVTGRLGQSSLLAADSNTGQTIAGLTTAGQGGLLDVAIDPAFASNQRACLAFSEVDAGTAFFTGTGPAHWASVSATCVRARTDACTCSPTAAGCCAQTLDQSSSRSISRAMKRCPRRWPSISTRCPTRRSLKRL
jgi:hypothetical protein